MKTKQIAEACMQVARGLGLKESERGNLATHIVAMCMFGGSPLETATTAAPERTVATKREGTAIQTKKKQTTREVKKEENKERKLLCRSGVKCHCDVCARDVFTVINDVYDGMTGVDFASKFMPIDHGKLMTVPMRLRAVDKCVMTDCPVCGGDMTLVLWGSRPANDFGEGSVGSVGGT